MQQLRSFCFLLTVVSVHIFAHPTTETRYQNFEFSPEYSSQITSSSAKSFLSNNLDLLPWHVLPVVNAIELSNGNTWSVYTVDIKADDLDSFYKYKDEVEIKENRLLDVHERRQWKGASFF